MHGGRIGVAIDDFESSEMRGALSEGAAVRSVTRGSPAADGGVEGGDIVVEFDGERVRSARQLSRLVQETPVGRVVPVLVMRDDERVRLVVTTKEDPDFSAAVLEWMPDLNRLDQRVRQALPWMPRLGQNFDVAGRLLRGRQRLGIGVTDMGPQLAEYFGVDGGVLVTTVVSQSVAAIGPLATAQIDVLRDGATITLKTRFEERPQPQGRVIGRI